MKKKNHKIVRLAVTASMMASLGVGLYSVSLGNNSVAKAEQLISSNPIADETSPRSITFWKYEVKDVSELGERGDGKEKDVDKEPLAGIKFEVKKVSAVEGGKALENPLKQKEGEDYTVGETVGTVTTSADGSAKIDLGTGRTADGIYLVTELADDRVSKPADPFFVHVPQTDREDHSSLIYDVQVQPKNILNSLLEPDKTVEGQRGYSIKAGQEFDWEAQANIPNGLYQVADKDMVISPVYDKEGNVVADIPVKDGEEIYADHFTMSDTLVKELKIDGVKVQAKTDDGEWTDLTFGTDYSITIDGTKQETAPVTSTTDTEKNVVMDLEQAGMKKVAEAGYTMIRTVYTTHTENDFNGVLKNHFAVDYLSPGLKPIHTENPEDKDPEYFNGGFDIEKTASDKDAPNNKLAGAEFMIAESRENAEKEIFIANDGNSYKKSELPEGVDFLLSTTEEDGVARFDGLALNWYEDANKNGKQDIDEEPTFDRDKIEREYWVVETKAPTGYELLKEPKSVMVNLNTATNDDFELDVVNEPKTDLPFTGGEGTMLIVAIAIGAITVGTAMITIEKKRRQA
ncbi:MAG: SpaH/EbpB family LPXTG-anchored major pilin [Enterococcus sp.]|uniref:SpaH/EbpB family LPXTG-anchored major pilin n=1 Tax=Enterococcus sp. TaxID=35783 RepID=UPI002647DD3B|nr:SpaH/EbpB family LPXTG-anchored major pilin [Enterococcus sp.]MDN6003121.1 SpaH/EbpB family LPXTG-anchored major pilin [Enterococcus sp.]MDN6561353.1 SpaH/EbpB family LPXTG-anchored major pilin [Enterococcus sp.]